jgi:hypothetical protein
MTFSVYVKYWTTAYGVCNKVTDFSSNNINERNLSIPELKISLEQVIFLVFEKATQDVKQIHPLHAPKHGFFIALKTAKKV